MNKQANKYTLFESATLDKIYQDIEKDISNNFYTENNKTINDKKLITNTDNYSSISNISNIKKPTSGKKVSEEDLFLSITKRLNKVETELKKAITDNINKDMVIKKQEDQIKKLEQIIQMKENNDYTIKKLVDDNEKSSNYSDYF
jgi:hypothetical protein